MNTRNESKRGKYFPIKKVKWIFVFIFILFLAMVWIGYQNNTLISEHNLRRLGGILRIIRELPSWQLMIFIFLHNSTAVFLMIILGLFFGIPPLISIAANGLLAGIVISKAVTQKGIGFTLVAIVPHGIFEIPAVILAASLGVGLGLEAFKKIFKRGGQIKDYLRRAFYLFLTIILPTLFVAAGIETALKCVLLK